ncbi:ImmA/IrrE family metallo-endopeptidase [Fructobacillus papyrifericola]|uniref:ImmA/IrrE family metallo-endopeptidase n=1 Tax=Fructobacillus papyrifericola TaxID=2713172 RepID=A0ABS5QRW2_9LACO|nr:ImmA/IrrE family metallo-endopeptidase [Fructobacillus papyrifericola]MBS9335931.1 ImmA/IrrE family metallo-endopeptidase [Fructobacillus papyrifericola]
MDDEKMMAVARLAADIRAGIFRLEDNRDLFSRLEGLGVELLGFFDQQISALLKWDNVTHHPIIAVNDRDSEKKQIFSLAHEIGHLIIDYGWLPEPYKNPEEFSELEGVLNVTHYRRAGKSLDVRTIQREKMMDDFARNFLMPYQEVEKCDAENGHHTEKTIEQLVARYYVRELVARKQLGFVRKRGGEW